MKNSLFIISEFVDAETNSTGYYWSGIIKGLAKKIDLISVISTKDSIDKSTFDEKIKVISINASIFGLKFKLFKPLAALWDSIALTKKLLNAAKKNDIVLFGTNPIFLPPLIAFFCRIKQIKTIHIIHDLFPENIISISKKGNVFFRFLIQPFYKNARRNFDCLICIGKDMEERLLENKTSHQDIKYIPNWVAEPKSLPIGKLEKNKTPFIFQYFGNIGKFQDAKILIEAIALIDNEEILFQFIGGGNALSDLKKLSVEKNIKNISFISQTSFKNRNDVFAIADISIVTLADEMIGCAVPSKAYFSISAGKKIFVIGNYKSELSLLIQKTPTLGWVHSGSNSIKLANKFKEIYLHKNNSFNIKESEKLIFESTAIDMYYAIIEKHL